MLPLSSDLPFQLEIGKFSPRMKEKGLRKRPKYIRKITKHNSDVGFPLIRISGEQKFADIFEKQKIIHPMLESVKREKFRYISSSIQ